MFASSRGVIVAFVLAIGSGTALAQSIEASAPPPRHEGLFLRVTPGFAGSAAKASVDGSDLTLSGGAGRFGIAAGWSIQPRLILTAELLGHAVLGPKLESKGSVVNTDDDVVWGISYAGLGVNWYSAANLYLHGSLGALVMTLETDTMPKAETELGWGSKLGAGYEWWVSSDVGLGVGIELLTGQVDDGDATWTMATLGLAFSATYN